ncbi:MAG: glycosyltransferase [Acetobacteraceae bacterium]|nr:glycosyltransferase [Acetobacteraceae bacterium]
MSPLLHAALVAGLCVLAVFPANLLIMCALSARPIRRPRAAQSDDGSLPAVCVQIPAYNERLVVRRAIAAAGGLDWPRDRLQIQILDDSTDDTTDLARAEVRRLAAQGLDIRLIHRQDRRGYKAGALAAGLARTSASFVAVLDADFVPPPSFLRECMATLLADSGLGFVQARWGHLNRRDNLLTRTQALVLDAHFVVEQAARDAYGLVLPFNGTCGVWRRDAIADAGGWQHETLTEDLDLSVRAHLAGWRAAFRPEIVVPGELPATLTAWRGQQSRWTKGYAQCARKLCLAIWRGDLTFRAKLAATVMIGSVATWPVTALVLAGTIGLAATDGGLGIGGAVAAVGIATGTLGLAATSAALVAAGLRTEATGVGPALVLLPLVFCLNAGLLVANCRAVAEGLLGRPSAFVRTPKRGGEVASSYGGGRRDSGIPELLLAIAAAGVMASDPGSCSPLLLPLAGLGLSGALLAAGWVRRRGLSEQAREGRRPGASRSAAYPPTASGRHQERADNSPNELAGAEVVGPSRAARASRRDGPEM